jgi:hypothetical protein
MRLEVESIARNIAVRGIQQKINGALILSTFALLPLNIFPSGGPQVVDLVIPLVGLSVVLQAAQHEIFMISEVALALATLAGYVSIVNTSFAFNNPDFAYVLSSIYMVYPVFMLAAFAIAFRRLLQSDSGMKYLYIALLLATLTPWTMQGAYERTLRNALSFNNPNQLGYFSLLLYICWLVVRWYCKTSSPNGSQWHWWKVATDLSVFVSVHVFTAISLSRASWMALAVVDLFLLARLPRKKLLLAIGIFLCLGVGAVACYQLYLRDSRLGQQIISRFQTVDYEAELNKRLVNRLERGHQEDSVIKSMFGTGGAQAEGTKATHLEVHNFFGAMFKSYGAIGIAILVAIGALYTKLVFHLPGAIWYLGAILVYNMAHNGIRFRPFWIALALVLSVANLTKEREANSSPLAPSPINVPGCTHAGVRHP